LQALKRIASETSGSAALPECRVDLSIRKAVKYAASSWLVRSKLGVAHLRRTATLEFGGHDAVTVYEGGGYSQRCSNLARTFPAPYDDVDVLTALILSWWLQTAPDNPNFYQQGPTPESNESGQMSLKDIFRDIFEECRDQGLVSEEQSDPASVPLHFYQQFLNTWTWTCKLVDLR